MATAQDQLAVADDLFAGGHFAAAEQSYAAVLALDAQNAHAMARLGYLALLANRLDQARHWLTQAIAAQPAEPAPQAHLAEAYCRADDFAAAAPLLRAIGRETRADKLELFQGQTPYAVESAHPISTLPFVVTDPLPIVQVRVNESPPVNFLIDTGAADVVLDPALADEVGARIVGESQGTFAGGKTAPVRQGGVDLLTLGDFTVRNLPVAILDTRPFAQILGGLRIDGILGTVLFYHFLTTLDYPGGRLVLRLKTAASRQLFQEKSAVKVPFWLAGDHFMVAHGTVNQSSPKLFLVDTGMAGGGFTCSEATLQEAGIELDESQAREGIGGGGKVKLIPFTVQRLALGEAVQEEIRGLFSGPLPLGKVFGFSIDGLISHAFFRPYALTLDFDAMKLYLEE